MLIEMQSKFTLSVCIFFFQLGYYVNVGIVDECVDREWTIFDRKTCGMSEFSEKNLHESDKIVMKEIFLAKMAQEAIKLRKIDNFHRQNRHAPDKTLKNSNKMVIK